MAKVVLYEDKWYLLRCVGLTPILYFHIKKSMIIIRTHAGVFVGKLADFENRKLSEEEKRFVDNYAEWFVHQNGQPHEHLQMSKTAFEKMFNDIFT